MGEAPGEERYVEGKDTVGKTVTTFYIAFLHRSRGGKSFAP
jgi:hypothetical protein